MQLRLWLRRPLWKWSRGEVALATATGLIYFVVAQIVFAMIDQSVSGAAFWPASGLTLAVLLRTRRPVWPLVLAAVAVADLAGDATQHVSVAVSLAWAAANTIEPLVGAAILRWRHAEGTRWLTSVRVTARWTLAAALAGPTVGGLLGALGLRYGTGDSLFGSWWRWSVGDALGVLVVAPLLLIDFPGHGRARRSVLFAGAAVLVSVLVSTNVGDEWYHSLTYLLIPLLAVSAMLDGPWGGALAGTVTAFVLSASTAFGRSPFHEFGSAESLLTTQAFVGALVLTALFIGAMRRDLDLSHDEALEADRRSLSDPLTGLANRAALDQFLPPWLATPSVDPIRGLGVLYLDLDGFKEINDHLGHAAGDGLLQVVAGRIAAAVRPADLPCRIGGDEFVVVAPDVTELELRSVQRRVEERLAEPAMVDGCAVQIRASVGRAWERDPTARAADVLRLADRRMFDAKNERRAQRSA